MQHKSKFLITGRFIKRSLSSYVVFLLMIFSFSMVFASTPEITIYTPSTDYTNQTYINVTVNVSEDNNVSSFIDWNRSLIGYWDFEPSHIKIDSAIDNSPYSNNGSFVGRSLNNITSGKYGNAMYFNGSSEQYLDCGNNNSLNITDEITIEAWIKEFTTSFNVTFGHSTETEDYAYDIQQTSDGGYIITGEADYNPSVSTSGNVSLIKLDSFGNVVKNATYDKFGKEDFARSVQQTDDGGYILAGETTPGDNQKQLWCIKTDSDLNIDEIFSFVAGGNEDDSGHSIVKTSDGNYVIAGYEESFDKHITKKDIWLLKIDNTGSIIKNVTHQASGHERPWFINETENGEFLIAGSNDTGGSKEIMFLKTDSDFKNSISGATYGWGNIGRGDCVKQTNDGKYILTGYTNATYYVGNTYAQAEIVLIKIDTSGNEEWKKTYGSGNRNIGHSVQQTNDGGFIIAGVTNYSTTGENNDYWIIKTDSNGDEEWNRTFGGDNNEDAWSILQTTDGGYIITGDKDISITNKDIWIIKTDTYGNITESNNNQSLNKTIVGKGRDAYQLELFNGTITGYINNINISTNLSLSDLTQYWHHIVLTYNTTSGIKLYINGTLVSSDNTITDPINTNLDSLIIGKNYSGKIDEVRIWNRSLSHEEINASYDCSSSYYKNITNLAEGTYPYYAHVIDEDGDENSTENRTITVDTTSPVFSNQNPMEGNHPTNLQQDITVNISDALSGVDSSSIDVSLSCSNGSFYLNNVGIENAAISYSNNILTVNPSNGGFSFSEDVVIVTINVTDNATNHNSTTWSFYPFSNVYVYGDGLDEWYDASHVRTIQEGINNVSESGTVYVWNGTYNESSVQLNKSVNLIGNSSTGVILINRSLGFDAGINVTENNCSVQKLTINEADVGLLIYHADNITVSNCRIFNNGFNIRVNNSNSSNFISNRINSSSPWQNIRMTSSHDNNFTSNIIYNGAGNGIEVRYSNNNTFESNEIYNITGNSDSAIQLNLNSEFNTIKSNNIHNNHYGISVINNANNNTILNNTIENNSEYGLVIHTFADNNLFYNNYIKNNTYNVDDSCNNTWNITKTLGTNIIGGPYRGGNYWDNYSGYDTDHDGMGNNSLPFKNGINITYGGDYYPLVISPNVTSYSPTGQNESRSPTIILRFNKSMNQTTTYDNITISSTSTIATSPSWSSDNKTLNITTNSTLGYNTDYTISLNWNASDTYGNVMRNNLTWSFRTITRTPNPDNPSQEVTEEEQITDQENETNSSSNSNTTNTDADDETEEGSDDDLIEEPDINSITEIIKTVNLTSGVTNNITFTKSDKIGINRVNILSKRNLINVSIKILVKDIDSEEINEPEKEDLPDYITLEDNEVLIVYKYYELNLTINNTDVSQDDLEKIIFEFKILKSLIEQNNTNVSKIIVLRNHNGKWNYLNTTLNASKENQDYLFFEVETPGFSTFAVVGSKVVESEKLSTTSEDPEIPWILIIGFIISVTIILIIVLFKARYIYFEKKEIDGNIKK